MNGDQAGNAFTCHVLAAHRMAGALGRDHEHVHVCGRNDLFEMDIEAVRKRERLALGQVGFDALFIQFRLSFVIDKDHDDVRRFRRFRCRHDFQACLFRFRPGFAAVIQSDDDVYAALVQVQRMRVSLAAVADDSDGFTL